jgi:hypothetical protein
MQQEKPNSPVPEGVRYARWAGNALGSVLMLIGIVAILSGISGTFDSFKACYFIFYGIVLNIPFRGISDANWKRAYGLLIACSVAFVFVMVVTVMFNYMEAADRGERLGVPGLEGTLIFIALLQVPAVLFQRKPDLLD